MAPWARAAEDDVAIDWLMAGCLALGAANIGLTLALVCVYGGVFKRMRTPFTFGLLVFGAALLIQNGLVVYAYGTMMPLIPAPLSPYLFWIGLLESTALAAMLWTAVH